MANQEFIIAAQDLLVALNELVMTAGDGIPQSMGQLSGEGGSALGPEYMALSALRPFDRKLKEVVFIRERMVRALGVDSDFCEEYRTTYPG